VVRGPRDIHRVAIIQKRAFSVVGPSVWNGLPSDLRSLPRDLSSSVYKLFKTLLFGRAWAAMGAPLSRYLEGALYKLIYRKIYAESPQERSETIHRCCICLALTGCVLCLILVLRGYSIPANQSGGIDSFISRILIGLVFWKNTVSRDTGTYFLSRPTDTYFFYKKALILHALAYMKNKVSHSDFRERKRVVTLN